MLIQRWHHRLGEHTQKKAPHVPFVAVILIPTRKLPYRKSVLLVTISAIGINPPCGGVPPLTISCSPASPPLIPLPAQSCLFASGFGTTLLGDASLPNGPRASAGVIWYFWGSQSVSFVMFVRCKKSVSSRSVYRVELTV